MSVHHAVAGGFWDLPVCCRNRFLVNESKNQIQTGKGTTHPLPRGGTDFITLDPLSQHATQSRKPLEPVGGLQHYTKRRLNKCLVRAATMTDGGLIGKRADGFESTLNCH